MSSVLNTGNYYSREELSAWGFKSVGRDVLISRKSCIYGAENMSFGDNIRIDDFVILAGKIEMGSHIHIGAMSYLSGGTPGIFMGDFTGISPKTYLTTSSDDYSGASMFSPVISEEFKKIKEGSIIMCTYSILGAGSIVMPKVRLAEGTAIGAMSFVRRSTQPWTTYFGIPAQIIGKRSQTLIELSRQFLEKWNNNSSK